MVESIQTETLPATHQATPVGRTTTSGRCIRRALCCARVCLDAASLIGRNFSSTRLSLPVLPVHRCSYASVKPRSFCKKHRTGCTTVAYRGQQRPRQKKRVRIAECPALQLSRMAGLRAFLSGRGRVPHNLFSSCGQIEGYHVGRTVGTYHVTMAVAVEVPWERTGTDSDPGAGAVLLCSARRFTMSSLELALDPRLDPELL